MKTPLCTMSKSETTSASNCKVKRDGEAGRRGARWQKVTFTLDFFSQFLALKGLSGWSESHTHPMPLFAWQVNVPSPRSTNVMRGELGTITLIQENEEMCQALPVVL